MKKVVLLLLLIIMTVSSGCTRIPKSQETGVMPGEYEGLADSKELSDENKELSGNLESTKKDLEKLKEDYLNLAKKNDKTLEELNSAQALIKVFKHEEMPRFLVEEADKNSITNFLNVKKNELDKSFRGIEIIPLKSNDNMILFNLTGYGDFSSQLYAWETGEKEPVIIDRAHYGDGGGWKWLLQDKYLIIYSSDEAKSEKIIVDVEAMNVINSFESGTEDAYLIPGTSSIIIQKSNQDSSSFVIYNFITGEEKSMTFDFQNKNLKFEPDVENNAVMFTGKYNGENGMEYSIQAVMKTDKLKEIYEIKTIEESLTMKNSKVENDKTEDTQKGTD